MKNNFKNTLGAYKQLIDADIVLYCEQMVQQTAERYGESSLLVANVYTELLRRDAKRIRGALTLVGYEMCGGANQAMIIKAARAIEMMHAYILIIDDIQDRGELRRGGPTVHKLLEATHNEQKWVGDPVHNGMSLSLNAALLGLHSAEMLFANLEVSDELRVKALNIMNHTMAVTVHGQTHDIINEISPSEVSLDEIENVLQWKTAHYTFLNPIHMGMVLAGAPCDDTNAITEYALHTGKAFQITDDLAVVSTNAEKGKTSSDDIREGKQTLLVAHAMHHAAPASVAFLKRCLGKQNLSNDEFHQCQAILIDSGAAAYAKEAAQEHVGIARASLKQHASRWAPTSVQFLDDLAQYLITRNA